MGVAEFFVFPRIIARMSAGPLGPFIDEFADQLQERGYSTKSIQSKIRLASKFSYWLECHDLGVDNIGADQFKRFLAHRKRIRRRARDDLATLRQIAETVCGKEWAQASHSSEELGDRDRAVEAFRSYLLEDRGLSVKTVKIYQPFVSHFLSECCPNEPLQFDQLTCADITGFVQRHVHGHSHSRAQLVVKALRAFLRYLQHRGKISNDLAASVPSVAAWSFATLPAFLQPDQVECVLEHCDRETARGRRDYAMLLLLARLGLRAGEVADLMLDDIDWNSGCFVVRNKGGCWTRMPLPQEVGEAIVDYLANGRPSCTDRHVFIRHLAPRTGFTTSSCVSAVASCTLARAGVEVPRSGAHVFRHTLATEMLRRGASLAEIGQLLRHQNPDTTRIYAKVDLPTLRPLALPWPGDTQ